MKKIILLLMILTGFAYSMEKAHIWQAVKKEETLPQPQSQQIVPTSVPEQTPLMQLPVIIEPKKRIKNEAASRKISIKILEYQLNLNTKPITEADIKEVSDLFNAGADANYSSTSERNILFEAVLSIGNLQLIELFLDNGVNVNQPVKDGQTPLVYYLNKFAPYISKSLENPNIPFIHFKESHPDIKIIAALIKHGADVNATDSEGRTPLMRAAFAAEPEIVKLLLYGMPALLVPQLQKLQAERTSYFSLMPRELIPETAQYLRADPNIKDKAEKTALNYAIEGLEIVSKALDYYKDYLSLITRYGGVIDLLESVTKK